MSDAVLFTGRKYIVNLKKVNPIMLLSRVVSFFKYLLLCLVLLFVLIIGGVNLPFAQRLITDKANKVFIEKKLPVHVDKIKLLITGRLGLSGVRIIKNHSDTIVYAGEIKISVKIVPLIFRKVNIMGLTVNNAAVNIGTDPSTGKLDIISIFSSGEKSDTPQKSSGKKWDISIGSVYLNNIRFSLHDSVGGIYTDQSVKELTVTLKKFSLTEKQIFASYISIKDAEGRVTLGVSQKMDFNIADGMIYDASADLEDHKIVVGKLQLDEPQVQILTTATNSAEITKTDSSDSGFPGDWDISGVDLKIIGGSFQTGPYDANDSRQTADSDFKVTELNARFSDVRISNILSQLNLDGLSFNLANGFRLEDGKFILNSDSTRKTTLRSTLRSSLSHINLSVESASGLSELIRSYKSASFTIKIDDTEISAGDVFSFLPGLAKNLTLNNKRDFRLAMKCDISGNTDLLKIKYIDLKTSKGASISFSGEVKGIIDPQTAKYSIGLKTGPITPAHLSELLSLTSSSVIVPDFNPISIEGKVDSTLTLPQFHFALESHSGNLIMDGIINTDDKSYSLRMSAYHLDLGRFSKINDLGIFTGTLDLSGKDFIPAKMKLVASLEIDTIGYKGYNYKNIRADLTGDNGSFKYSLKADDPSFICDLTGTLNLSDSLAGGKIKGLLTLDADKVNIFKGGWVRATLEAGLNRTVTGLSGFASVKDVTLKMDNNTGNIENLDISFHASDTLVKGSISTGFLKADGYYEGSVSDIKKVFKEGKFRGIALLDSAVSNHAPYISLMDKMFLSLEASYDPVISLLVSDTIFSYNKVFLKMTKDSTDMAKAEMSVDRFNVGKSRGYNATIALDRNPYRSQFVLKADSIKYGPVSLTGVGAEISSTGDSAWISLYAADSRKNKVYDIEGIAYKSGGEIRMTTSRELWVINGYDWKVSPGDFLIMDSKGKDLQADLHLKNELRTIDIYGRRSGKISFECGNLGLKMLLIPGMNNHGYDGEFTGRVDYMEGIKSEITAQMDIRRMKMNEAELGYMKISGIYQSDTLGNIEGSLNAAMNDSSVLKVLVRYGKKADQRSLSTEFDNLPLIIIGSLSAKYISDLRGTLGGRIDLKPVNGKPLIEGEIRVNNIGLKLVPVNARFYLPGDIIKITDNKLLFNNFTVLDSLRNKLDLNGSINLSDPRNIMADLQVTSNRIQVMNTTARDNPEFNGSVFVNSRINLSGPLQKPSVQGSVVLAEGTVINYRYTENLAVSETQKLVTFASLSEDKIREEKKKIEITRISRSPDIVASLEINPNALFNFEISRGYDIGVHITGGGFLTYSMMPGKAIDLTGMYEIREGSSELKIPGWPRKDFTITPGSFVKWDGQVDDPELRIETTSKVRGSYVNPIDQKNREVNFLVYMKLAGRLSQIDILFDVRSEDQYLTSVFNTMSTDERMRQAINLLIFGSVQLPNATGSSDYMTQQINQFWESQINSFTKSAVKFVDFSLGIDSYKDPANAGKDRTSVSYQVKKDLFKDRGSVMVSGRMNDTDQSTTQSTAVIENFIFEYSLDSNRTKYLKVYRQQNYEDLLEGEVIKSGVGFIYRKNYDRVSDIWRKENKKKGKK